ncbi:hypothetical protein KV557_24510 [Kitasatospora aureofaciens]|uniref:hypothetical protein n=1 Tax=Kitasatospora aureofaciens TaxID=1894 RepID=UPI001C44A487|nr:hypothetical protein [Kitasatospora aureofaciens]MBV6700227.1 hypothetical protein [Kitasatospora aureofaciens]
MSRSTQAFQLGRHLSEKTGVRVELVYDSGARWLVQWPDGPTLDEMRDLVDRTIAAHPRHFGLLADRQLSVSRMDSVRAWAARAVAARRDGSLATEVARDVARRRELGLTPPRLGRAEPKREEYYALLNHIERLVNSTSYPERPDEEADVPVIEQLLTAGRRDEYKMADILVNELLAPEASAAPALRAVNTPTSNQS